MANSASSTLCKSPLTKCCHDSSSIACKQNPLCSTTPCDPPAEEVCDYTEPPCVTFETLHRENVMRKKGGGDTDRAPSAENESSEERVKSRVTTRETLPECSLGRRLIEHACDGDDWLVELMEMELPFEETYLHDNFDEMEMYDDSMTGTTERMRVTADVKPFLKRVLTFRDLLNQNEFQKAEEFLDQFIEDKNAKKYRRDVLRSLNWCFQRNTMRNNFSEHSKILLRLHSKLVDELKKEEMKVESIEEAFQERNWLAMNALFTAKKKSLSKEQLHQVILLAAQKKAWREFLECVDLGADLVCSEGKLVYTHTLDDLLSPPDKDKDDDSETATLKKGMETEENLDQMSPLHEALKTGEFKLEKVEDSFQKNTDFCNITDKAGDPLLHLAVRHGKPEIRKDNVKFLLQYNADVNTLDSNDKTPMQYLQHPRYKLWEVELLMIVLTHSEFIHSKTWRAGADEWTPLHMLCNSGHYEDIDTLIQKGDDPRALRRGLTLIDTVILQESLHWEMKRKILETLLKEPIKLGPFHAQTVQKRSTEDERKYVRLLLCGKDYLYPSHRLLFPLISTYTVREAYKEIVVMLLEGDAVCERELASLQLNLNSLDDDPYFLQLIKAFLEKDCPPADNAAFLEKKDCPPADNAAFLEKKDCPPADNAALLEKKDCPPADNVAFLEKDCPPADNVAFLEKKDCPPADNVAFLEKDCPPADNAAFLEKKDCPPADNVAFLEKDCPPADNVAFLEKKDCPPADNVAFLEKDCPPADNVAFLEKKDCPPADSVVAGKERLSPC